VESCPLTKLDGGLIWLHSADESAVKWLTSHRTWSIRQQQQLTIWDIYSLTYSPEPTRGRFCTPKLIKIGSFLTELFKKINGDVFIGPQCSKDSNVPSLWGYFYVQPTQNVCSSNSHCMSIALNLFTQIGKINQHHLVAGSFQTATDTQR